LRGQFGFIFEELMRKYGDLKGIILKEVIKGF